MKKILALLSAAALSLALFSCSNSAAPEVQSDANSGGLKLSLAIPRFVSEMEKAQETASRVVMPHTKFVTLEIPDASYKKSIEVEESNLEPGAGVEYATIAFLGISVGTYGAGDITVYLDDVDGNHLTYGTNTAPCTVSADQKSDDGELPTITIYALPLAEKTVEVTTGNNTFSFDTAAGKYDYTAYHLTVSADDIGVSLTGIRIDSGSVHLYAYDKDGVSSDIDPVELNEEANLGDFEFLAVEDPDYAGDETEKKYVTYHPWVIVYGTGKAAGTLSFVGE